MTEISTDNTKQERIFRVEQYIIKKDNQYYQMFEDFTHKAKNLYNHANYLVRQEFINTGKWLRYQDLNKILRADIQYPDYKNMGNVQSAQQVLRILDSNWSNFFKAIKDWKEHKEKYTGRPKIPKYKKKDGHFEYILTNQATRLKGDKIVFPKCFNKIEFTPKFIERDDFLSFQQARIIPKMNDIFVLEFVYRIKVKDELPDNNRYLGIDLGVDNLATVTSSEGDAFIINGKGLKAKNNNYNKLISYYQTIITMTEKRYTSNRLKNLYARRNRVINDFMHKAAKYIVDFAAKHEINTIIIGYNKGWKQKVKLGKIVNQTFVQIPHKRLIDMITYKAKIVGIKVITVKESYTSGTSFLDDEKPTKRKYNKKRRKYRGLFISNTGKRINADVNASLQIIKKSMKGFSSKDILSKKHSIFNPEVIGF